jgi:hypothetical protein
MKFTLLAPSMVAHVCKLREAEAGRSRIKDLPGLHSETLSQKIDDFNVYISVAFNKFTMW